MIKKLKGSATLLDVSNKEGFRIEIEIKRDAVGEVVLNHLYALTQMQVTFRNQYGSVGSQPRSYSTSNKLLKPLLNTVVKLLPAVRCLNYAKARERAHILEGLAIALSNIDPVIDLIRSSKTPEEAREGPIKSRMVIR